jgi:hypothetical protein
MAGEPDALIRSFAGQPFLNDPRAGQVEGARGLRNFVSEMADWLRKRDAVTENVALTPTPIRTVEEVVLHLLGDDGSRVHLPVAIVADRNPDRSLKAIRVYHSMWPLTGSHDVRPPLLPEDRRLHARRARIGLHPCPCIRLLVLSASSCSSKLTARPASVGPLRRINVRTVQEKGPEPRLGPQPGRVDSL